MPAKKWFERVVGENSACYLVTTTNFEEHKERGPKWLPKGSISAERVSTWQALRSAVQAGLDAAQHEVYSPYIGGEQVAVYADGDLFAYIDMLPLGIAMRNALGGKYSKIPVYYYDHARFFSNGQSAAAPPTAPPALPPATLECRDPANLNVEHQELFHCSSEYHDHNLGVLGTSDREEAAKRQTEL
ncbi:hypothetical protein Slin15195_G126400 [Septoria linicola]|uniref:Uncharacterized protein n=1 Tax=Septoria linicola TaxID=215465 RepID=A0A9Q9BAE6_9PEZI|nr:hypothetical protein Slin15195_G126400 [Septoria linicola]